jgi:hypothetical protein
MSRKEPMPASIQSDSGYLTITRFSGDASELAGEYARSSAAMAAVGRDHGLIAHVGARAETGFMVVNLWPSKDGSESAARDRRRLAVLERSKLTPDRIERDHFEVVDYLIP